VPMLENKVKTRKIILKVRLTRRSNDSGDRWWWASKATEAGRVCEADTGRERRWTLTR